MKKLICITGASGSGKTTLSTLLAEALKENGRPYTQIHLDNYFKTIPADYQAPADYEPAETDRKAAAIKHFRENKNFDNPENFEYERLTADLMQLFQLPPGKSIMVGAFDFATNTYPTQIPLPASDIILLDGLFLKPAVDALKHHHMDMDILQVAVTTSSYFQLRNRRFQRDAEKRGLSHEQSMQRENTTVALGFFGGLGGDVPIQLSVSKGLSAADIQVINDADDQSDLCKAIPEIMTALALEQPHQNASAAAEAQCSM